MTSNFRILAAVLVLLLTGLAAASAASAADAPGESHERHLRLLDFERTVIVDDVAWYRLDLRVGDGPHDIVRLHRIVREQAPWLPIPAPRGVFLTHGDGWGFAATFLPNLAAPGIDADRNLPVFLARDDVDVWGIDFRWALVPAETADLAFMADWGFDTSLADLDLAITTARWTRLATGSGFSRLHLLGFSRGGQLGWAHLGAETQRPAWLRNIGGFVALEHSFKTNDEAVRQSNCASHGAILDLLENGTAANDFTFVAELGELALSAPEDPSPFFPILGNADLAEWIGADVAGGAIPNLHSVGGVIDPETLVTELSHAEPTSWFAFLAQAAPYQPLAINRDGAAVVCDEINVPYDDHLAEIEVPIFYLGVGGGFGALGFHATTLVASTDVSTTLVQATADPARDLGHNDTFLAIDAETLIWRPILDWIRAR